MTPDSGRTSDPFRIVLSSETNRGVLIPTRYAEVANNFADHTAVVFKGNRISWGELHSRSNRVRGGLVSLSLEHGESVAIIASNSIEFLEIFLAIVSQGLVAITLPTMLTANQLAVMLNDGAAKVVFASRDVLTLADEAIACSNRELSGLRFCIDGRAKNWRDFAQWRDTFTSPEPVNISPADQFNIIYSSGTTGIPKGIVHSHANRAVMAAGYESIGFNDTAATMIATPLYTNVGIPAALGAMWGGGKIVLQSRFDAQTYLEEASRERATQFFLVPTMAQRLLAEPDFSKFDLSATRLIYIGGSHVLPDLKKEILGRWSGRLLEIYGMTEGAPCTSNLVNDNLDKLASVGRPVAGCDVRVIDDNGQELPVGESGEIVGRSGIMMMGYNNLPRETEELIWRDRAGNEYFRSGDVGKFDEDGFLYILDRKKDMIISGGLNIYASDLEAILARHQDVSEVAVIGIPSERWGETPLALVVPKVSISSASRNEKELEIKKWANEQLGKFQRLGTVTLISSLPRNALGKVLKRELRQPYWDSIARGPQ